MRTAADPYEIVERYWPYDGPRTAERVASASEALGLLVRYLNNSTRSTATLAEAASIAHVINDVKAAVAALPQLLAQLSQAAQRQASDPTLYDDRRDRPGSTTAIELIERLAVAGDLAQSFADQLAVTSESGSHLGNDDRPVTP